MKEFSTKTCCFADGVLWQGVEVGWINRLHATETDAGGDVQYRYRYS